jgi:putative transposase
MPRKRRLTIGGHVYHVLNRAAGNHVLFRTSADYRGFEQVLAEARARFSMRILAYCVMPNHWHLLLWPVADGDLQAFARWLTSTHAIRWNAAHERVGHGAVYQSRYKSIPVNSDTHLLWVCRYVERNALRACLVERAEEWAWGSLCHRLRRSDLLSDGPTPLPINWVDIVNSPQTQAELEAFRHHVIGQIPFGAGDWPTQRRPGRPRVYDTYQ